MCNLVYFKTEDNRTGTFRTTSSEAIEAVENFYNCKLNRITKEEYTDIVVNRICDTVNELKSHTYVSDNEYFSDDEEDDDKVRVTLNLSINKQHIKDTVLFILTQQEQGSTIDRAQLTVTGQYDTIFPVLNVGRKGYLMINFLENLGIFFTFELRNSSTDSHIEWDV